MLVGSSICWEMTYLILMSFSIDWLHATKAVSTDAYLHIIQITSF
jgi:hypothetical protein